MRKRRLAFGLLVGMVPVGVFATATKIKEQHDARAQFEVGAERIIEHWYRRALRAAIRSYIKTGNYYNDTYRYFNEAVAVIFDLKLDQFEWVRNMVWQINRDFERREPRILVREDWVTRRIHLTKNYLDSQEEEE